MHGFKNIDEHEVEKDRVLFLYHEDESNPAILVKNMGLGYNIKILN